MRKIAKFSFFFSMLVVCMSITGQDYKDNILSDSTKFAEYVYINMHYPLIDFVNNIEGTVVYKYEVDSVLRTSLIKIVSPSGSSSLDMEGERLLRTIPKQENNWATHEISIDFKLADNKIYMVSAELEEIPEFPGGDAEIIKFISANLNWPPESAEMSIQGTIICGFIIEKDGSISTVEIVRPLERYFDAEAMRVIKRMPKWKTGKKDGKPVRVYYLVPIRIRLSS